MPEVQQDDTSAPSPVQVTPSSVQVTSTPHPDWKPTVNQPKPFPSDKYVDVDPKSVKSVYHLMISSVVPRPIAFVSSVDTGGNLNVAPYSYFGAMGHNPPMISLCLCKNPSSGASKDSLLNILATKEFVVNMISEWMIESANYTCGPFPKEVDEFKVAGLTPIESQVVAPPRVKESAVQMECKLRHVHEMEKQTIILAEVVMFHVQEELYQNRNDTPSVRLEGYAPMARMGGNTYGRLTSTFDLPRPGKDDWQGHVGE